MEITNLHILMFGIAPKAEGVVPSTEHFSDPRFDRRLKKIGAKRNALAWGDQFGAEHALTRWTGGQQRNVAYRAE